MTQALLSVVAFIAVLAMAPWAIKWLQGRGGLGRLGVQGPAAGANARVVSALAVGQQQRVVTVEVGPPNARTWLVLGVTTQQITTLHSFPAPGFAAAAAATAAGQPPQEPPHA